MDAERKAFEADAEPMGFDLKRQNIAAPEPWSEYEAIDTGHRWGGWLARAALSQPHASAQEAAPEAQLLFDFGGFLTSSERQWVFSSRDDAAPMVDAIRAFAAQRGIDLDAPHAPAQEAAPPKFPTMLRKMWSGSEVQAWIDKNWSAAPHAPADMILHCPACHLQHIDAPDERTPDWKNEPHRSHLCHGCGFIWRPADVPTNGVAAIKTKGKADSAPAPVQAAPTEPAIIETIKAELDALGRLWMDYGKQAGGFNTESGALYGQIQFTRTKVLDYVAMLATPAPVAADTLRDALQRIASFKLSQFMGPHDMAMECVHAASAALAKQPEPTEPSDCDSCEGTGSGGMGVGCTDCLGTGIDPHASPAPVAAESCVPTALDSLLVTREELQVLEFRPAEFATPARAAEPQEQADAGLRALPVPAESVEEEKATEGATHGAQPYDPAIEALRRAFCALPKHSFLLSKSGGVCKVEDLSGRWIEFQAAHELFDPVKVDSLLAASTSAKDITQAAPSEQEEASPLDFRCPWCGAQPGVACATTHKGSHFDTFSKGFHFERRNAAHKGDGS